ncbi:GntR family transcriptional regulator [Aquibacillus rhizosphaerae]|uniref:GntR family transcriptional regulator n=1 Tax=Aquibacillus rhizosphaerae TaxID=3051431 RepID=A0ABT7LBX6_9BACI|nr:GntR family transcriptional regulator [Aquibacillus sp. LR5S19]MDL4842080.1 GntR family transcriptional regulator [Aquibacillus sp. LR5S19]
MQLPIKVSEDSREPIYHQIETQIKTLIISGQLPPDTPLPSIRVLSHDLACSVITTRRAYQDLENKGLIKTVQGKGTFVKKLEGKDKDNEKLKIAMYTFEKAIQQTQQIGCTEEEIIEIFDKVFKQHFDQKGEME